LVEFAWESVLGSFRLCKVHDMVADKVPFARVKVGEGAANQRYFMEEQRVVMLPYCIVGNIYEKR